MPAQHFLTQNRTPCKYGNSCKKRTSCKYLHFKPRFETTEKCRYGLKCLRKDCYFVHPNNKKEKSKKEKKTGKNKKKGRVEPNQKIFIDEMNSYEFVFRLKINLKETSDDSCTYRIVNKNGDWDDELEAVNVLSKFTADVLSQSFFEIIKPEKDIQKQSVFNVIDIIPQIESFLLKFEKSLTKKQKIIKGVLFLPKTAFYKNIFPEEFENLKSLHPHKKGVILKKINVPLGFSSAKTILYLIRNFKKFQKNDSEKILVVCDGGNFGFYGKEAGENLFFATNEEKNIPEGNYSFWGLVKQHQIAGTFERIEQEESLLESNILKEKFEYRVKKKLTKSLLQSGIFFSTPEAVPVLLKNLKLRGVIKFDFIVLENADLYSKEKFLFDLLKAAKKELVLLGDEKLSDLVEGESIYKIPLQAEYCFSYEVLTEKQNLWEEKIQSNFYSLLNKHLYKKRLPLLRIEEDDEEEKKLFVFKNYDEEEDEEIFEIIEKIYKKIRIESKTEILLIYFTKFVGKKENLFKKIKGLGNKIIAIEPENLLRMGPKKFKTAIYIESKKIRKNWLKYEKKFLLYLAAKRAEKIYYVEGDGLGYGLSMQRFSKTLHAVFDMKHNKSQS